MDYCDSDDNCKGYDYSVDGSSLYPDCALATVSDCPDECEKNRYGGGGNTGSIVNFDEDNVSGCYIKSGIVHKSRIYGICY